MDRYGEATGVHPRLNESINSGPLVVLLSDFVLDPFVVCVIDPLGGGHHNISDIWMANDGLVTDPEITKRSFRSGGGNALIHAKHARDDLTSPRPFHDEPKRKPGVILSRAKKSLAPISLLILARTYSSAAKGRVIHNAISLAVLGFAPTLLMFCDASCLSFLCWPLDP
ncbi:hypothetical protein PanWU01x14_102140 [Parasponia andersonii]|uniref:Uncharacterized protein n=1 Tax=Parasponia andersonii TaxID=3476 RepID=A0A2P5D2P9_PARAD|nr:hypothetical protein PanWU01x14_102140 [Parasponia andersonii]